MGIETDHERGGILEPARATALDPDDIRAERLHADVADGGRAGIGARHLD